MPAATDNVTVERMENVLRPLIVIGGSVVLTLVIGWLVDRLLRAPTRGTTRPRCGACCAAAASRSKSCCAPPC